MTTVDDDIARLKTATREAHEAAQGLREAARDIRDAVELAKSTARATVDTAIEDAIRAGLAEYRTSLDQAIVQATAAVDRRFDTITDILLGEDAQSKGVPLIEYAERVAHRHRLNAARALGETLADDDDPREWTPPS